MIRIRHVEGTPTAIERRICSDAADVGANQIEKQKASHVSSSSKQNF
jgi:hypothetical protein